MRIGVLELLTGNGGTGGLRAIGSHFYTKQYASIMPQAIAVWCRDLGHDVFYATFAGLGDPKRSLPNDLDVVFIGANTPASALAYALAKLYRRERTMTVIGGPHARSYARDCQRFFDVVVLRCDRALVADIVGCAFEPGSIVSSNRTLTELPSVEERMPEIRAAYFYGGRANPSTTVGVLASVGCPYTCNFCTDWNSPYALLPLDRLAEDLRYMSQHLPGVRIGFHDPNFAVKFDPVLEVLEELPPERRNPYAMESSLSVLRGARLQRLRDTRCLYVAPGVESWSSYSNKAQAGAKTGTEKLRTVIEQFTEIHEYVPGLQANFILGIDADAGDEPVELTKQFISETPFVWPALNIPTPFGGTPFFDDCLRDGRILRTMPFALYYVPYLVMTLRNYDPIAYYEKLTEISTHLASSSMLWRRLRTTPSRVLQFLHIVRTRGTQARIRDFREIVSALRSDPAMLAFHEGRSDTLPAFYQQKFDRMLGRYGALLSADDRRPVLDQAGDLEAHLAPEGQPQPIALAT